MSDMSAMHGVKRPVFILGAPRSGTSILAWSLAQDGQFWTSNESGYLWDLFGNGQLTEAWDRATRTPDNWLNAHGVQRWELFSHLGAGLNALVTSRSGGKRWIEQTPTYTYMAYELAELFLGAQFIHLVRDGRRVVHSMVNFERASKERGRLEREGLLPPWASDFSTACETWSECVEIALEFSNDYADRTLTVHHEDLVESAGEEFTRIYAFLGVHYNEDPIKFFWSSRINSSFLPEAWGTAPTNRSLAHPWHEWTPEQRLTFAQQAGSTFRKCGYADADEVESWAADVRA
jgi:hypothetical protein